MLSEPTQPLPRGYHDVEPREVSRIQARIIDVREPYEVEDSGTIPGAVNVPLSHWPAITSEWDPAQPVLLICRSGGRSGRAAEQLASRGFRRVYNLSGGMLAYADTGLPIERRRPDVQRRAS